jgi:hypothetical protein
MQVILGLDNNDELHPSSGQAIQLTYNSTTPTTNTQHNGTLNTLLRSTGLIDILGHQHPSTQYPATYNRGRKHIDIILVSASLLPKVKRSSILPYNSLFQGDHRPCYIDIDTSVHSKARPLSSVLPAREYFNSNIRESSTNILMYYLSN